MASHDVKSSPVGCHKRELLPCTDGNTYNNCHFDVKMGTELFLARLIICYTLPDQLGGGS